MYKTRRGRSDEDYARRKAARLLSKKLAPDKEINKSRNIWHSTIQDFCVASFFIGTETLRISAFILGWLKFPTALLLACMLVLFLAGKVLPIIQLTLQPICIIPGIAGSSICPVAIAASSVPKHADYSGMVEIQSASFEQLLDDAAGGSALSLEIKKAEIATADLATRVRGSNLGGAAVLAETLDNFVADAKKTGRGLQKLTAKIAGAVDSITAVNEYALQSIEQARKKETPAWSLTAITPWGSRRNHYQSLEHIIISTFEEAMSVLSTHMQRLILEAEYSHSNLLRLEEHLATLHEIIIRDDSSITAEKSDLLEQLWTKLGGNKRMLQNFDNHLELLKGLTLYRKQALVYVVAALHTLHAMSEDMDDMRERVAAPDLVGVQVPAEIHIKSIRMGLERLRQGRIKAKDAEKDAVRKVLSLGFD